MSAQCYRVMIDDINYGNYHYGCVQPTCFTKNDTFMQLFVYMETTRSWFHTADWKTRSLHSAFIYWYKTGMERPWKHFLLFQNEKSGNESWKEKKELQTRSFFNIHNSYKLSFSLKKLFVNLWHDQVCSHHLVAIRGSTYTVFSFYLYLLSQCISKSEVT